MCASTIEKESNGAVLGFERKLWKTADKLRKNMDAAEYKHVVLGLIFLKHISKDSTVLSNIPSNTSNSDYWSEIVKSAESAKVGEKINQVVDIIEANIPDLKDILPKEYNKKSLNTKTLSEVIKLVDSIDSDEELNKSIDVLGKVYEYFLGAFAESEGQRGGQYYTPKSVVKLLVEMVQPYQGKVFDPCCGSGGMFVQSSQFIQAHGGDLSNITVYGQESNFTTWRLCRLNLWMRKIPCNITWGDSFLDDQHNKLKSDFILSNPPFNDGDWGSENLLQDKRWQYGLPPSRNANYAWIQNYVSHLADDGVAGFVLTNGALSSNTSNEFNIRKTIIEEDLVECVLLLPDKLFYNTQISACLWFINKNKSKAKLRDRSTEVLFIDASNMGKLVSKKHRELRPTEIQKIVDTYNSWRSEAGKYSNIPGFCYSASLSTIRKHKHALVPGRYTGCEELELPALTAKDVDRLKKIMNSRFEKIKELENVSTQVLDKIK